MKELGPSSLGSDVGAIIAMNDLDASPRIRCTSR